MIKPLSYLGLGQVLLWQDLVGILNVGVVLNAEALVVRVFAKT